MADQEPTAPERQWLGADRTASRRSSILAQYIKDLSVENPSAPQVFQWQAQPTLDVQFNINVEKVADDVHEVTLKIESRRGRTMASISSSTSATPACSGCATSRKKRCRRSC